MRIGIPEKCDSAIRSVAKNYSTPNCNGFVSTIYVNYPIHGFDELKKNYDFNMVIIDDLLSESSFVQKIRDSAKIKYNSSGFEYKGLLYSGDYCVQQIIENPFNNDFCVLIISTNNADLLKSNLFTRRVIIPTYSSGYHKYWNNDALVYYQSKYYSVFEWGDEMKVIK